MGRPRNTLAQDMAEPGLVETDFFADSRALRHRLAQRLTELSPREDRNPLRNPVLRLALDLVDDINGGELDGPAIDRLIRLLAHDAFLARAGRLRSYVGETDMVANDASLDGLIRRFASNDTGDGCVGFETFRKRIERSRFGIVFTAHPTFGLSRRLLEILATFAADEDGGGITLTPEARDALLRELAETDQGPDAPITLDNEHCQAEAAIARAGAALDRVTDRILRVAQELYPDRWTDLSPSPITLASWVGYDIDGRTDISWADSLGKFMTVKATRLAQLGEKVAAITQLAAQEKAGKSLATTLRLLTGTLTMAIKVARDDAALFPIDGRDPGAVRTLASGLAANDEFRLVDTGALRSLIDQAVTEAGDGAVARALVGLRADLNIRGLGTAHVHVRLNATQIHNAIRHATGMESAPDDPGRRRRYINRLSLLIDGVSSETINFGSLLAERATARRLFMTVRQMLKYGDSTTPIRFLIAESDTPFTVLAALYFAKLFGVEDKVDISPLFETPAALERGADVIAELLENQHYRDYVKARGRLCIQTGFSDAGRHLGQIACTLAVERLHMKLARLVAESDLSGVEVLTFDTHGESVGRGAHPAGLNERFEYLASPASRALFRNNRIPAKHEVSFQGGDGYLHFGTPKLAYACITRVLEHVLDHRETSPDPFYDDADNTLEFFLTITRFNTRIMNDRDYGALVGGFATSLLRQTGSRQSKRQHDTSHGIDWAHPTQLRAIPHNAVLHQLGWLANTLGGVGEAIAENADWFVETVGTSERMRRMIGMVAHAEALSSTHALSAYARLFEPEHWVTLAEAAPVGERRDAKRKVARLLTESDVGERTMRIARHLRQDAMDLREGLERANGALGPAEPLSADALTDRAILHALRLALIHQTFLLAARIPTFTSNQDIPAEQIVKEILALEVPSALAVLTQVFPADPEPLDLNDFGEAASYMGEDGRDYKREHETLFEPLARNHDRVLRIGTAVSNLIGAHG